jgi:hypothetical protein
MTHSLTINELHEIIDTKCDSVNPETAKVIVVNESTNTVHTVRDIRVSQQDNTFAFIVGTEG